MNTRRRRREGIRNDTWNIPVGTLQFWINGMVGQPKIGSIMHTVKWYCYDVANCVILLIHK